ncbi:MAG: hypothetical protein NTW21_18555 [Verrucomicrobia bacterium]|nr:hypothetical protein [Verrucomicrobiota bacterium]
MTRQCLILAADPPTRRPVARSLPPGRHAATAPYAPRPPTMVTDSPEIPEGLLDAARDGDEPAWRELVELLYPLVEKSSKQLQISLDTDRDGSEPPNN